MRKAPDEMKEINVEIKKGIVITIGETTLFVTEEEAKALYKRLEKIIAPPVPTKKGFLTSDEANKEAERRGYKPLMKNKWFDPKELRIMAVAFDDKADAFYIRQQLKREHLEKTLKLLAQGKSKNEIAKEFDISPNTAEVRIAYVKKAIKLGYLKLPTIPPPKPSIEEQVISLYKEKVGIKGIVEKLGIKEFRVRKILIKAGLIEKPKPKVTPPPVPEGIVALIKEKEAEEV